MLTSLLSATAVILVILAALTACTTATPAPSPTATPAPRGIAATPALLPNTPEPEATATPTSFPEPTTTESTAAPRATPTSTPPPQPTVTSGPTPTPSPPRALAPLEIQNAQEIRSALYQTEMDCIGDPERLARTLAGPGTAPSEEQAELTQCLEDETLARLFLAGFVPGTEPLSLETSTCVRTAFEVIDPRKVMTAGLEGDPGTAMAGSMAALTVTIACLNDEEWEAASPEMGMRPEERAGMQCLMEALGGPREMAAAMRAAQEGDLTGLTKAEEECGLEMGPLPGQAPATPTPAPMATPETIRAPVVTPTQEPTSTRTLPPAVHPSGDIITPLNLNDPQAALSQLSKPELMCLEEVVGPDRMPEIFDDGGVLSADEQADIVACLEDQTVFGIFLTAFLWDSGPLSEETSACLRSGFEAVDLREAMTPDHQDQKQYDRAEAVFLTGYFVAIACQNEEEWNSTAAVLGLEREDQKDVQCFLEEVGGPQALVEDLEGSDWSESGNLHAAVVRCELDFERTIDPEPAGEPPPATTLTIIVAEVPDDIPEYDRSQWRHWTDEDGDCQDTRQEVLVAESLVEVSFETDRKCRVATGRWYGAFTGAFVEEPGALDIDHLVPLKSAHRSGGWRWDAAKKAEYANLLEDDDHLIAVTAGANRSKGAKGPEEWAPPEAGYWCRYATDWTEVKSRWLLTMTQRESEIVMDMVHTCENPPMVEVWEGMVVKTGVHKSGVDAPVYGSCEEAEAAGEEQVQGSQGGGKGFPAEMVPSARDGDGDGVVCER